MRRGRLLVLAVVLLLACGNGPKPSETAREPLAREVVNVRAFARLYGVLRWFHPSDEAADLDWNRYAVHGLARVRGAADRARLAAALSELVAPIGPTIQIVRAGEPIRAIPELAPARPDGLAAVAWQHHGPGFDGGQRGVYESKRTGRTGWVQGATRWAAISQRLDAAPLRGKKLRLRAQLRAANGADVGAWLRVDRPGGQLGFFDNMMDRAVKSSTWQPATIEGEVAADAVAIVLGGLVTGDEGWFDAFVLEVADGAGWTAVALANADFDRGTEGWTTGIGRDTASDQGFRLEARPGARDGGTAAVLTAPRQELTADLFDLRPRPGEAVEVDLGDGLRAHVPIVLWSRDGHTLPAGQRAALDATLAALPPRPDATTAALADVVVAWNVFAHFYPYLDVIRTDWHAFLDRALADALAARDTAGGQAALERLVVALEDGHGNVVPRAGAPLALALAQIEGRVVVLASADPAVHRGDEVLAIDGVPAAAALAAEVARVSGSPQWRAQRALHQLGAGPAGTTAAVRLQRERTVIEAAVTRGSSPPAYTYPPIGELEPGIWLIDLSRADAAALEAKMPTLAGARGIVFDLRGYPNGTHGVLAHLIDRPEHDRWMHVAQVLRPNVPGPSRPAHAWTSIGWDLEPVAPRIRAKVAFVTGPGAISYAESVMGYVEALGYPIVGAATAGANGNVRAVKLPSGRGVLFTGMKVTRHDGTRSHVHGIRPTVPVERTLAGVRAGRDEEVERAVALVR